jgi:hypothetical protein
MVRAIIFASALMIGSVGLAQDTAPPADTPSAADTVAPADTAAPADTPPAADATPPADTSSATPAAAPASADYPPCSAKVQDHCIQGAHRGASHRSARRAHHK